MQNNQSMILILKPTPTFLRFLKSQLPEHVELPSLQALQADSTAYVMQDKHTDEATLDEIERHFPTMFRHEIARWLGENARNKIEGSFLDFLCCFKFEIHTHILLLESSLPEGKQLLRIKPRSVLLKMIQSSNNTEMESEDEIIECANFAELTENATVIIKNFNKLSDIKDFLHENHKPIFETEMSRMYSNTDQWPNMDSYETFNRYFAVQIHTNMVHLSH